MSTKSYIWVEEKADFEKDYDSRTQTVFDTARHLQGYFKPTSSRKKLRHRIRQAMKVFLRDRDSFFTDVVNP